jgi:hypothetical protein
MIMTERRALVHISPSCHKKYQSLKSVEKGHESNQHSLFTEVDFST